MAKERIIISLTTWRKRIKNIPTVLDTIFNQTLPPDMVVLNLAYDEIIPNNVREYIDIHQIEVNRVPDTKVYKKLIPTLKRYPDDCIISIDDDWLYPEGMIADFMHIHERYPQFPISGNHEVLFGFQCHCGCASLTKASFFGNFFDCIDDDLIGNCLSDDIVYTYFATASGHPYIRSTQLYFTNMKPFSPGEGYSESNSMGVDIVQQSFDYLVGRFGLLVSPFNDYICDSYLADLFTDMNRRNITIAVSKAKKQMADTIYATRPYRLGLAILKPAIYLKKIRGRFFDPFNNNAIIRD